MNTDITQTSITGMNSSVQNYQVPSKSIDGTQDGEQDTYYDNLDFGKNLGFYKTIPELKKAIDAYATWVLGKGYKCQSVRTQIELEHITGWGEDSFNSILWNLIVTKKFHGDAFAEIIRDDETGKLINLKPLDPSRMRVVVSPKGIIKKYQYRQSGKSGSFVDFKPNEILHLVNDRICDEIHGVSVCEACKWVIEARNEAMKDWRRISHRSTIRILYIEEDDKSKLTEMKRDYADAINKGELLILPIKKGEGEFADLTLPPAEQFLSWIKYLENFFYQAVGIPKVILGGSEEFTEASSKISYLTYEQIYTREVVDLEADLWNQLGIRITFNKPASLMSEMLSSEDKNTEQTGFQPNDVTAGVGK